MGIKYIQLASVRSPVDATALAERSLPDMRSVPGVTQVGVNVVLPDGAVAGAHIQETAPPPRFNLLNAVWTDGTDPTPAFAKVTGSELVDAARSVQCAVEEHESPPGLLGSSKPPLNDPEQVKMMCVIMRRAGMSREDFIDYYETGHSRLAAHHLPMIAGYRRNYPVADAAVDFDVVTEMWFRSRRDHQALLHALGDPALGAMFAEDEERLFNRSAIQMFLVREHGLA